MKEVKTNATAVFDELLIKCKLENDSALAKKLEVWPSAISAMRKKTIPLGKALQGRIIDKGLMSSRRLKALLDS